MHKMVKASRFDKLRAMAGSEPSHRILLVKTLARLYELWQSGIEADARSGERTYTTAVAYA